MISLLRKDLLILRRSRLLVGLLVVYPVAIALLIGFAISRSPSRPRVAIVDEAAPGETIKVGSQRVAVGEYARQLFSQVQSVPASTRAQAIAKVKSGAVIAAVVIPPGIAARLSSDVNQVQLEVLYNGDALEQSLARSTLESALAQANLGFSEQIQKAAGAAIGTLLSGGNLGTIGAPEDLIGLSQIPSTLGAIVKRQPRGRDRTELERIDAFAGFAAQNLSLARRVLSTISQPIRVEAVLLQGRRTPLNTFAVVVAASVSLMFVCVLLAAGGVALEREEHTLARLIRKSGGAGSAGGSLVSREALLAEKTLLAAGCAFAVAFAMLAGIGAFVALDCGCSRSPSARSRSQRSAWRSARSRGRSAPRRCSRSPRRCRSPCSRSFPPAPCPAASTTRSARSRSCFPSRPPCRHSTRPSTAPRQRSGSRCCTSPCWPPCSQRSRAWGCAASSSATANPSSPTANPSQRRQALSSK